MSTLSRKRTSTVLLFRAAPLSSDDQRQFFFWVSEALLDRHADETCRLPNFAVTLIDRY
jgi:hypothetical protein